MGDHCIFRGFPAFSGTVCIPQYLSFVWSTTVDISSYRISLSLWSGWDYRAGVWSGWCRRHYCGRHNNGLLVINIYIRRDGLENNANAHKYHKCYFLGFLKWKKKMHVSCASLPVFNTRRKNTLTLWLPETLSKDAFFGNFAGRFSGWIWAKLAPIYSRRHWQHDSIPFFPLASRFTTLLLKNAQTSKFWDENLGLSIS